jgi:starch phosphorylase
VLRDGKQALTGAFMATALFVMEIGLDNRIPTYSGGLGMLAGDMAFSFADLGVPGVFVTLLAENGYTLQKLDQEAGQVDLENRWDFRRILTRVDKQAQVEVGGKVQRIGAWEYKIPGKLETRVLFLDTNFPENDQRVREATHTLYAGDPWIRLMQEFVLGVGGYRILKTLGEKISVYHLNESHAAFVITELLRENGSIESIKRRCAFTTHTPIPAGNDVFPLAMVKELFADGSMNWDQEATDGMINLSKLAMKYSGVTNAVSLKHRYVSERILNMKGLEYVTNGVYHKRWIHDELKKLYSQYMPGWEDSPALLVRASELPLDKLSQAHEAVKAGLVGMVNDRTGVRFSGQALTIGIAKRVTSYKRNGLILSDLERLKQIGREKGHIQIVLAGKTNPRDTAAKTMLAEIIRKRDAINQDSKEVRVAFLENYDIDMAKTLIPGCDLWVNNPRRPLEASGTSGMKAAMNGVLNFSVYDGWWLEGGVEGVNGWGIGKRTEWSDLSESVDQEDITDIYRKLSDVIVPLYHGNKTKWWEMAKSAIATSGPLFNSYRMVTEYVTKVYSRVRNGAS